MYFDRFDICEAYYLFAYSYHLGGDTSDHIFCRLRRIGFRPGTALGSSGFRHLGLTENGAEIYNALVARHPDASGCRVYFKIEVED